MNRRTAIVIALTGLLGLLFAGPIIAADGSVTIRESRERYGFSPSTAYANVGDSVTWTNDSDAPHNVTSDSDEELASENFGEGETFEHTFTATGTFAYHCTIHRYMTASVVVLAEGVTPPPTETAPVSTSSPEPGWLGIVAVALGALAAAGLVLRRMRSPG